MYKIKTTINKGKYKIINSNNTRGRLITGVRKKQVRIAFVVVNVRPSTGTAN